MQSSQGFLRISKCDNNKKKEKDCHSDSDINEWLRDVQIDTWTVYEKMDFQKYHERPTFRIHEKHEVFVLSEKRTIKSNVGLVKNVIEL